MPHPTDRAARRAADARATFVPTWARGRETAYHARTGATYTLANDVRADLAVLGERADSHSVRKLARAILRAV
jgi:hypothetical protein